MKRGSKPTPGYSLPASLVELHGTPLVARSAGEVGLFQGGADPNEIARQIGCTAERLPDAWVFTCPLCGPGRVQQNKGCDPAVHDAYYRGLERGDYPPRYWEEKGENDGYETGD